MTKQLHWMKSSTSKTTAFGERENNGPKAHDRYRASNRYESSSRAPFSCSAGLFFLDYLKYCFFK